MSELLPLFLNLTGRTVVLVGGGRVAAGKLQQLLAAGARVRIVAPDIAAATVEVLAKGAPRVEIVPRAFVPSDLDGAWLGRAREERIAWRRDGVPMDARKPKLLRALNTLYEQSTADDAERTVPWLNAPEDSWL